MDYLQIRTSDGGSLSHDLDGERVRIGRSQENDLSLNDPYVSSFHAVLERCDGGWVVQDLGGLNGTLLNGDRLEGTRRLSPGDRLMIGRTAVVFNGECVTPMDLAESTTPEDAGGTFLPVTEITPAFLSWPGGLRRPVTESPVSGVSGFTLPPEAMRIILEADAELVFHRPLVEILEKIMDLVERGVPFERGVLVLRQGDRLEARVRRFHGGPSDEAFAISRTIAERVIEHKEAVMASDALTDDRFREGRSVQDQSVRSVLCVPLWDQRDVIGLIYIDSAHATGRFRQKDLHLLTHLAAVAAVKIGEHRLFEQAVAARTLAEELQHASVIQRHLLPAAPTGVPGYRLAGNSVPCQSVGGDTYDFLPLSDGRWIVGLGDVSGKSLPAALLMCFFQASLRATATLDLPPDQLMARLNDLIHRQVPANRFITFFLGVLDPRAHTLTFANAGHDPPILLRNGEVVMQLHASGPPLGMFPDAGYASSVVSLRRDDVLFCCSDGVPDATSAGGEPFGAQRLASLAAGLAGDTPERILRCIIEEVERYCGGMPQDDDVTMVALKRME